MEELRVPIPPLEEQKRIVAVLDAAFEGLDRARAHTEANLQNARDLFEQKRASIFMAEESEDMVALNDVCLQFEYGTSKKSNPIGKVPVLRMGNLQDGEIDWDKLVYTDDEEDIDRYKLRKGDVLFNRTNSEAHVGKTSIFDGEETAIFAGYLIRVVPDPSKLTPEFLNHFLNSDVARSFGRTLMGRSVNQANISGSKLKTYRLRLPTISEQVILAKSLDDLKEKVKSLQTSYISKLTDLDDLRQSLLQKAFAGELT